MKRYLCVLAVVVQGLAVGCGDRTTSTASSDIKPLVGGTKSLPPEYRILAGHLSQELKPNTSDFRDDKSLTDIVAEGHAAILDLRGIKSSDPDISYIASQAVAAYTEVVGRLERINALPKPPSAGSLFVESFLHGLYGNVFAGLALGVDADNKAKAILDEVNGLVAALEKADALHLQLPRIAERYAAPPSPSSNRIKIDFDESWNAWGPHDWLYLYNAGGDLEDCTIVVDLTGASGQKRRNVHYVRKWTGNSWLCARYDPGSQLGDRRVGCMTVNDVATVGVRVLSPQFSTEVQYTYTGAEKAKDVARRIAKIKPHIKCRVRDSVWGASAGKVFVLESRLKHPIYKVSVCVVDANGKSVGKYVKDQLDPGSYMEVGSWQVSRNLRAGDRVTVYISDAELLSYIVP
jgi:hypothetical protein